MKGFVEYPLEEGGSILVEVDMPESEGRLVRAASPDNLTVKVASSFENALASIKPLANAVVSRLNNISHPPDEIGVEFGMSFKADGNAILTRVGADANFKVSLKWKNEKPQ
ncbi:MAG TPA: CU044_2847 family protein [Methanothrix soehngenii]|nr:CU044_2847 family protein [Methanothrix soehngenii]HPT18595.1 CU044_2847 family protein [Methanothrix sp.]